MTDRDYSKTTIYKIFCKNSSITDCYVGHTTNFTNRKYQHKCYSTKQNRKRPLYDAINEHGGWNNWTMEALEVCDCKDVYEATERERYWYDKLLPSLNYVVPNRTIAEYYKDHQADRKPADVSNPANARASDWYYANHDYAIQYRREYYNSHKEELNEERSTLDKCACGAYVTRCNMTRHRRTKKHLIKVAAKSALQKCF